jgi:hypothetical protein
MMMMMTMMMMIMIMFMKPMTKYPTSVNMSQPADIYEMYAWVPESMHDGCQAGRARWLKVWHANWFVHLLKKGKLQ